MSRYYHPTRHTRSSLQPTAAPTQTNTIWFKSPAILLAILLGVGAVGATLLVEFTTQHVIHVRADDSSDSAKNYTEQRQQHCQASVQHYKPGDTAINIAFADRPVTTQHISILNSLSVLGQCQNTKAPISNKQPGTSLILLLERIQNVVKKERDRKNDNPVVVTVEIQDSEPGPNQPNPKDIQRVKTLVRSIMSGGGALAIAVEDEALRNQLDTALTDEVNVQISAFNNITSSVDWAFTTGRQTHNH